MPDKKKAKELLQKAIDGIPALIGLDDEAPAFKKWQRGTILALEHVFGEGTSQMSEFNRIHFIPFDFGIASDTERRLVYDQGLKGCKVLLESMIEEIETFWEDNDPVSDSLSEPRSLPPKNKEKPSNSPPEIFIVHGRDEEAKEKVARFLEKIKFTPIILHEQANQGRTIIEKFEQHAHASSFAVVLLTPDDVGALAGGEKNLKPRARQNVIFELGYFIGALGRKHVCALTKGDVEIPTDFAGVVYITFDSSDAWKMPLIQELKKAGFEVDANLAF